jgi:hypothetical protein
MLAVQLLHISWLRMVVILDWTLFEKDRKPLQNHLYDEMINVRVLTLSREQCLL